MPSDLQPKRTEVTFIRSPFFAPWLCSIALLFIASFIAIDGGVIMTFVALGGTAAFLIALAVVGMPMVWMVCKAFP
jgi:hypothetical protein